MEAAFALPILILLIIGGIQLGILFSANAGLQKAVAEGARYATLYPHPTPNQIVSRVNSAHFALKQAQIEGLAVVPGKVDGVDYVDISMSYSVQLDFLFFKVPAITLRQTRRAYQP